MGHLSGDGHSRVAQCRAPRSVHQICCYRRGCRRARGAQRPGGRAKGCPSLGVLCGPCCSGWRPGSSARRSPSRGGRPSVGFRQLGPKAERLLCLSCRQRGVAAAEQARSKAWRSEADRHVFFRGAGDEPSLWGSIRRRVAHLLGGPLVLGESRLGTSIVTVGVA